jgi:hypothetical protein
MSLGLCNNCRRGIPFYFEMIEPPFTQHDCHQHRRLNSASLLDIVQTRLVLPSSPSTID